MVAPACGIRVCPAAVVARGQAPVARVAEVEPAARLEQEQVVGAVEVVVPAEAGQELAALRLQVRRAAHLENG